MKSNMKLNRNNYDPRTICIYKYDTYLTYQNYPT